MTARHAGDGPAEPELIYEVCDGTGWVTLNRPQARNALTFGMYERLADICGEASLAGGVRALVIIGAGDKAFAAGTDISQFRDVQTADEAIAYEARIDRVLTAVERCRVPTIAAITGACTGGGAAIAASCDLRVGTRSLRFGYPIARTLGNCLSTASLARMAALIGPARTKELIFTARLMEAEEALACGLLNEVTPDFGALQARASELAALVSGHAPLTLLATKEGLRRLAQAAPPGDDLVAMCYTSQDFREGIESFLQKRAARWTGT